MASSHHLIAVQVSTAMCAGAIISIGLMKAISYEWMENCLSKEQAPGVPDLCNDFAECATARLCGCDVPHMWTSML